jgi:hypothetical protein
MLTLDQVRDVFPEAKISDSGGHEEFYVHCRKPHKKGGIYKMSINAESGAYYCHDCGAAGNASKEFFDELSNFLPYSIHREEGPRSVPKRKRAVPVWENEVPLPGDLIEIKSLHEEHPARLYLEKRNITEEDVEKFGLLYCISGHYTFCGGLGTTSGRIIFPVRMSGNLIGWQARVIEKTLRSGRRAVWRGEKEEWFHPVKNKTDSWSDYMVPKYYTCPGMPRYKALFNFDNAIKSGRDLVVVCEGPIDSIKIGVKSIATLGSKISNQQVRIIKANWDRVVWILDKDIDTESRWFESMVDAFQDGNKLSYLKLKNFSDPGEATQKEIWKEILQND